MDSPAKSTRSHKGTRFYALPSGILGQPPFTTTPSKIDRATNIPDLDLTQDSALTPTVVTGSKKMELEVDELAGYVIKRKLLKDDIMSLFELVVEKTKKGVEDSNSKRGKLYRCLLCGVERRQQDGHGASNLRRHLQTKCSEKDTWEHRLRSGEFLVKPKKDGTLNGFVVDPNAIFLRLVIEDQLPFNIAQSAALRRLSAGLVVPHRAKLSKLVFDLYLKCKTKLKTELNEVDRYCLMFDGWSKHSKHYVCVLICFEKSQKYKYVERLLAFRPLPKEVSMNAEDHVDLLKKVTEEYELDITKCVALIGDHVSVNKSVSKKLKIPLIGCFSHRLNLAVKRYLKDNKRFRRCSRKVHHWMKFLRTNKGAAHLMVETKGEAGYRGILENKTRWTSTFEMLERYMKQEEKGLVSKLTKVRRSLVRSYEIPKGELTNDEIEFLGQEVKKIREVLHTATTMLQKRGLTVASGHMIIDEVCSQFPFFEKFFEDFDVPSPSFESALVKLYDNEADTFTKMEEKVSRSLLLNEEVAEDSFETPTSSQVPDDLTFEERLKLRKKKQVKVSGKRYINVSFIPCTSVSVERVFSKSKHFYSDLRSSLGKNVLEALVFLNFNRVLYETKSGKGRSSNDTDIDLELSRLIGLPESSKAELLVNEAAESDKDPDSDSESESDSEESIVVGERERPGSGSALNKRKRQEEDASVSSKSSNESAVDADKSDSTDTERSDQSDHSDAEAAEPSDTTQEKKSEEKEEIKSPVFPEYYTDQEKLLHPDNWFSELPSEEIEAEQKFRLKVRDEIEKKYKHLRQKKWEF